MKDNIKFGFLPTLADVPQILDIERVVKSALEAVDPTLLISKSVKFSNNSLQLHPINSEELIFAVNPQATIRVISIGKAATAMATAFSAVLGERSHCGLIIDKFDKIPIPKHFERIIAGHPVPNQKSIEAGKKCEELLMNCKPEDLTICLISGGGSALLTYPISGVTLENLQIINKQLLASGADINEINAVRRVLDRVKGGGLARMAAPSRCLSLILSDVIGDPINVIASGPTCADKTQPPMEIVKKYFLEEKFPPWVIELLAEVDQQDLLNNENVVANLVIGNNLSALLAAEAMAKKLGWKVFLDPAPFTQLTQDVALALSNKLAEIELTGKSPWLYLGGGESTVRLRGSGIGGRNQQLALEVTDRLRSFKEWCLVCIATDGDDGTTDAAGAMTSPLIFKRIEQLNLDLGQAVHENDSYTFFGRTGNLIKIGATGTNVNDLVLFFRY